MTTKIVECNGCGATISAAANARHQARQLGWRCLPEESTGGEIDFCAGCVAATESKITAVTNSMADVSGAKVDGSTLNKLAKAAIEALETMPAEEPKPGYSFYGHPAWTFIAGAVGGIAASALGAYFGIGIK